MRETLPEREVTTEPAEPSGASTPSRARWPLVAVGAVILFNLVVLRAEARPVDNLNDASVHRSMVVWANDRIEDGHLPLDGWYPDLSLGSSRFHHYQSLPHILGGYLAVALGPDLAVSWTLYLGMALWPIAVYAGGRLLGWGPWVSAIAAVCSPLLASQATLGFEWGSYAWRGYGTWAQLWGMWLLPFAWGLSWRSVSRGGSYWLTALVLALAVACHLLTGYLALLSLGVFVVVKWRGIVLRFGRAALVGFGSLLVGAWVVVPLVADRIWTVNDEFSRGKVYYDSFGAKQVMTWFASGELFDRGRLPMVTILVAAGVVTAAWRFRRDERARVLLGLFVLSLLLFFGRTTWGSLLRLLPGSGDLFLRRFISGVHLAGLYLAGVGAVRLGQMGIGWLRRIRPIRPAPAAAGFIAAGAAVVFLAPAFGERAAWATTGGRWIREQAVADATDGAAVSDLVEIARARRPGRFYGGLRSNWGPRYVVGQVPMYAVLLNHSLDHVGFTRPTWSLSSPVEFRFNDRNVAHYDLFAVRHLILEEDRSPPANAVRIAQRGRHVLWEVPSADYVDLVDVLPPIEAERTNLGLNVADWMRSEEVGLGLHPGIEFEGHPAPEPTIGAGERPEGPPGTVVDQDVDLRDGFARATVAADRPSFVMLKTSFDPRWQVTLDGVPVDPEMIAPSFIGRSVPPGEHVVTFEYEPFPRYDALLLVGLATLVALAVVPRRLARPGHPAEEASGSGRAAHDDQAVGDP